jgi:lysyl-tRNA synthetase class II
MNTFERAVELYGEYDGSEGAADSIAELVVTMDKEMCVQFWSKVTQPNVNIEFHKPLWKRLMPHVLRHFTQQELKKQNDDDFVKRHAGRKYRGNQAS